MEEYHGIFMLSIFSRYFFAAIFLVELRVSYDMLSQQLVDLLPYFFKIISIGARRVLGFFSFFFRF